MHNRRHRDTVPVASDSSIRVSSITDTGRVLDPTWSLSGLQLYQLFSGFALLAFGQAGTMMVPRSESSTSEDFKAGPDSARLEGRRGPPVG